MDIRGSVLRDIGLLLLVVLTLVLVLAVMTRDPAGPVAVLPVVPTATVTASPTPQPERVDALFLGSEALLAGSGPALPDFLGAQLGWQVEVDAAPGTGFTTGPAGRGYIDRIPSALRGSDADVVVVVASLAQSEEADGRRLGGNAQFVLGAIRQALPEARIVLVGPISAEENAAAASREIFTGVAARFGAFFVDPVGSGYLREQPELIGADGVLTREGAVEVARRLAAHLRLVLPSTVLASPLASPAA